MSEIIGSESLQTLPASADYMQIVRVQPGDGETVTLNPPIFSWYYTPDPEKIATDDGLKTFRFRISANSNMSSPVVDVITPSNCYNKLAPLSAGTTYYWQIQYRYRGVTVDNSNNYFTHIDGAHAMPDGQAVTVSGTSIPSPLAADTTYYIRDASGAFHKLALTPGGTAIDILSNGSDVEIHLLSPIRSFTIHASPTAWDRSDLADEDYLSAYAHPYMLFNASNRAAVADVVDGLPEWAGWVSAANTTVASAWWTGGTKPDPLVIPEYDWAGRIQNVAFIYQMTGLNASYGGANAATQLSLLADYYLSVGSGPDAIQDWIVSGGASELGALAFGYDWFYDILDSTQRTNVLKALYVRCRYLRCCFSFSTDAGGFQGETGADITGAYVNPLHVTYPMLPKWGSSHALGNFYPGMAAAIAGFNDTSVNSTYATGCRELLDLGLDYMIGVVHGYEGSRQGRGYDYANTYELGGVLYYAMLVDIVFPTSNLATNPFWQRTAQLSDRMLPVKWNNDTTFRDPFGDGGIAGAVHWTSNQIRQLVWFTQDGRCRTHYDNQLAVTYSGFHRPNIITSAPFHYHYSTPTGVTSYSKSQLWLHEGWVAASSIVPNHTDSYNTGVGFVMPARPSGGKGSHDTYCDGHFDVWAYGGHVTDGGFPGLNTLGKMSWSMNTVTVNGLGQLQPNYAPLDPVVAKFIAYQETDDYTYACADLTKAYGHEAFFGGSTPIAYAGLNDNGTLSTLTKVHRHILFMRGKYFVIWDDLAASAPESWQWVWHVPHDTLSGSPTSTFNYTVPGAGGDVSVYVQHIATSPTLNAVHLSGTDISNNPITTEEDDGADYYDSNWAFISAGLIQKHVMWICTTVDSATHNFVSVVYPVEPGGSAPTITRIDDLTVRVQHAGHSIDDTISFDPANTTANFVVDLESEGGAEPSVGVSRTYKLRMPILRR